MYQQAEQRIIQNKCSYCLYINDDTSIKLCDCDAVHLQCRNNHFNRKETFCCHYCGKVYNDLEEEYLKSRLYRYKCLIVLGLVLLGVSIYLTTVEILFIFLVALFVILIGTACIKTYMLSVRFRYVFSIKTRDIPAPSFNYGNQILIPIYSTAGDSVV